MASMAVTREQPRSAIALLLAVTLVAVQARQSPDDYAFGHPRNPGKPFPESTRVESQPTNRDESQFWASTKNTDDTGGVKQPRGGDPTTREYNYAMEATKLDEPQYTFRAPVKPTGGERPGDEELVWVSSPGDFGPREELARFGAMKFWGSEGRQGGAQRSKFGRESRFQAPVKTSGNRYPQVLDDGTELLWVTEPRMATPEEMARLGGMMRQSAGTSTALPGAQRTEVPGRADVEPTVFEESTESWEAGPWGTKHRPGAEPSFNYAGFDAAAAAQARGGSRGALPAASHNHP